MPKVLAGLLATIGVVFIIVFFVGATMAKEDGDKDIATMSLVGFLMGAVFMFSLWEIFG